MIFSSSTRSPTCANIFNLDLEKRLLARFRSAVLGRYWLDPNFSTKPVEPRYRASFFHLGGE